MRRRARYSTGSAARIGAAPAVAVPARRADCAAGDEQPRPGDQSFVDRLPQTPIGPAGIAHVSKPAIQHGAHGPHCTRSHQGQGNILELADDDFAQHDMHVTVDQPGHQRSPAAVDHLRIRRLDGTIGDFADQLILDQYLVTTANLVVPGIEHAEVLEEILAHAAVSVIFTPGGAAASA